MNTIKPSTTDQTSGNIKDQQARIDDLSAKIASAVICAMLGAGLLGIFLYFFTTRDASRPWTSNVLASAQMQAALMRVCTPSKRYPDLNALVYDMVKENRLSASQANEILARTDLVLVDGVQIWEKKDTDSRAQAEQARAAWLKANAPSDSTPNATDSEGGTHAGVEVKVTLTSPLRLDTGEIPAGSEISTISQEENLVVQIPFCWNGKELIPTGTIITLNTDGTGKIFLPSGSMKTLEATTIRPPKPAIKGGM